MWSADHYPADKPTTSMYGVAPVIQIKQKGKQRVDAIFWANASDTFVDIYNDPKSSGKRKSIHFISEAGELEFFILSSSSP